MSDFSWTKAFPYLRPRADLQASFERLGYRFAAERPPGPRPQRPRAVGETADRRARVELIGPAEAVFKATILALSPAHTSDLADFLGAMLPDWEAGAGWLASQLGDSPAERPAETHFRDFAIVLRRSGDGTRIVLGVTWQGASPPDDPSF